MRIELTTDDLRFIGLDMEFVLEPGVFEIFVGSSARQADLKRARFRLLPVQQLVEATAESAHE